MTILKIRDRGSSLISCRDCVFTILSSTFHIWTTSSILKLRTP